MITFCIPSKNNLRYLKYTIPVIKSNSFYENDILVFVDQDNDGTVEWLRDNNINFILNNDLECKGIGYAYDTMFKESKTDLVVAFHADMFLGKNADKHLLDLHQRGKVVCATCIEPPALHPPDIDKLIQDFGMWPEEFNLSSFNEYVNSLIEKNLPETHTLFAPWLIDRRDHVNHDPIFLSVFEDTDLFRRFKLAGYELVQSWKSYVYHLTCRGGQFEHANETKDLNSKSSEWKRKSDLSMYEYIRKWGGLPKNNSLKEPIPNKKYDIGFIINGCSHPEQLQPLEPLCSNLYVGHQLAVKSYIQAVQPFTSFNLKNKFKEYTNPRINDILVTIDVTKLTNESFNLLYQLPDIISESGEIGEFELDTFKIQINSLDSYETNLIYANV